MLIRLTNADGTFYYNPLKVLLIQTTPTKIFVRTDDHLEAFPVVRNKEAVEMLSRVSSLGTFFVTCVEDAIKTEIAKAAKTAVANAPVRP